MEQEYPLARTSGKTIGTSYLVDTRHVMAIRAKQAPVADSRLFP
jgi:hypothetical protein